MPMTISMDDTLKAEFAAVCKEIGMSPSTAINIFARAVVREQGIPFRLTAVDAPAARTQEDYEAICRNYYEHQMKELAQAYKEMKTGRYITDEELEESWRKRHPEAKSL